MIALSKDRAINLQPEKSSESKDLHQQLLCQSAVRKTNSDPEKQTQLRYHQPLLIIHHKYYQVWLSWFHREQHKISGSETKNYLLFTEISYYFTARKPALSLVCQAQGQSSTFMNAGRHTSKGLYLRQSSFLYRIVSKSPLTLGVLTQSSKSVPYRNILQDGLDQRQRMPLSKDKKITRQQGWPHCTEVPERWPCCSHFMPA